MESAKITTREDLLSTFEVFRSELDDYNDRRERLIKVMALLLRL
jgi:hypothetical protein